VDVKRTEFLIFRAWKLRLLLASAVVIALIGGWELYRLGLRHGGGDGGSALKALRAERDGISERLRELETRNQELERQLALLEHSRRIDEQAYAVFKQERSGLQSEIQGLRDELAFYRGIMSPQQNKVGLEAQDFDVEPALGTGRYRYQFVVTQLGRNEQVARGRIELALEGLQDAKTRRLGMAELSPDGAAAIEYRFRYFQAIDGQVQLPEGFIPERVLLKAVPATAPRLPLEWTFDWPLERGGASGED
jgi:hypothetical protein